MVEKHVGTRTGTQVRSHAQKHYLKYQDVVSNEEEKQGNAIEEVEEDNKLDSEKEVNIEMEEKQSKAPISSLINCEV